MFTTSFAQWAHLVSFFFLVFFFGYSRYDHNPSLRLPLPYVEILLEKDQIVQTQDAPPNDNDPRVPLAQQRDNRHDPAPPAAVRRAQAHNTMTDYHHRSTATLVPVVRTN
jgi:hypothetical protein